MTLTQLKYMIAVAETGNFTSASKKVFVTQPSLTCKLKTRRRVRSTNF